MEANMITTLKLAGLSAVLSAGLVTGFTAPEQKLGTEPAKIFYDRVMDGAPSARMTLAAIDTRAFVPVEVNTLAKGDRARTGRDVRCTDMAWLLVPADCVPNFDPSSASTSEVRKPGNVSALIREPASRTYASR
jgi:hypothetical protein